MVEPQKAFDDLYPKLQLGLRYRAAIVGLDPIELFIIMRNLELEAEDVDSEDVDRVSTLWNRSS